LIIASENLVSAEIVERFVKLLAAKRLAHAYLFVGPKHIGKSETALAVAKLVNCEKPISNGFCDTCSSCKKIEKGMHPDVHVLDKDDPLIEPDEDKKNKSIKIEHIRQMIDKTQMSAFEAKKKVFIIKDVEFVTLEASNALLKTLEEPTNNTLIFLTTSVMDRVLETIKSRCQVFYFFPLSRAILKQRFLTKEHASEPESHFLSYFSEGCPGRIAQGEHDEVIQRRNEAIDQFLFSEDNEPYLKKILADEAKTAQMIQFLFCWFKDLMLLKTHMTQAHLVNADRLVDLQRSSAHYSFEELEDILEDLVNARKALDGNFNVKIALALLKEKTWKK
jgi:DNA polymerase-3 subunit delta'